MTTDDGSLEPLAIVCSDDHERLSCGTAVAHFALAAGMGRVDAWKLGLCAMELALGAVQRGGGGAARIEVRRRSEPPSSWVELRCDDGPVTRQAAGPRSSRVRERGLLPPIVTEGPGLDAARRLADKLEIRAQPGGGIRVLLEKRLPR